METFFIDKKEGYVSIGKGGFCHEKSSHFSMKYDVCGNSIIHGGAKKLFAMERQFQPQKQTRPSYACKMYKEY